MGSYQQVAKACDSTGSKIRNGGLGLQGEVPMRSKLHSIDFIEQLLIALRFTPALIVCALPLLLRSMGLFDPVTTLRLGAQLAPTSTSGRTGSHRGDGRPRLGYRHLARDCARDLHTGVHCPYRSRVASASPVRSVSF